MAVQTKEIARLDGGLLVASIAYDDVSLLVTRVDVVNQNTRSYTVVAQRSNRSRTYSFTIQPGTEIHQNIGSNAANRLQLTTTPSGKLDGLEWSLS